MFYVVFSFASSLFFYPLFYCIPSSFLGVFESVLPIISWRFPSEHGIVYTIVCLHRIKCRPNFDMETVYRMLL